jgi:hypothetical protein
VPAPAAADFELVNSAQVRHWSAGDLAVRQHPDRTTPHHDLP